MKTRILILSLQLAALAVANPAAMQEEPETVQQLEAQLSRRMDELDTKDSIDILGGMVALEKVEVDPSTAEEATDPLVSRIERFLRSRRIEIKLPNDGSAADFLGRAIGSKKIDIELRSLADGAPEARTKLKKMILPVLLALKLKALIVLPIVITVIAFIGKTGLGLSFLALLLSGLAAMKSLFTPPPPYTTRVSYGIVKPHDVHHEHWHRSQEEMNQPYRGWEAEYNADQYPYQDTP